MVFSVPMDTEFRDKVEKVHVKRDVDVRPGDTVKVHLLITEAGKDRVQVFEGVVISVKGSGLSRMITVRKISHGVGVEKILPINSPLIKKIEIVKRGNVRRSKLYYMRKKVGKRSLDAGFDDQFEAITDEEEKEEEKEDEKDVEKKEEGEVPDDAEKSEDEEDKSGEKTEEETVKEKEVKEKAEASEEKGKDPADEKQKEKPDQKKEKKEEDKESKK